MCVRACACVIEVVLWHLSLKFLLQLMSREDAEEWFKEVIPFLANLLLRLPKLLEDHWKHAYGYSHSRKRRVKTGLRILEWQQAGMVILSRV